MTAPTTRTGDTLIVYPFEKLREALTEATKAIRDADRTVVDDDAFSKLCDCEDNVVAHLAAHFPASAEEAIFLLHILRDRMVENFNPDVRSAANRDIVRGVTAYLSDTPVASGTIRSASAEAKPIGATLNGPKLAAEFTRAIELLDRIETVGKEDDDDERLTKLIDEMYQLAPVTLATRARNLAEVAAKMRLALWHDADKQEFDVAYLKSALADLEQIGGAS